MTIALGILATDGLVIAADSEVSAGDYMKIDGQKVFGQIHFTNREGWESGSMTVTGAGDAGYLEAAFGDVADLFTKSKTLEDMGVNLKKYIKDFYRDHVIPFRDDTPHIWLIVGVRRGQRFGMWTTRKNRAIPCRAKYSAVGAGEMYAGGLMQRLCGQQDVRTSMLLAAYVIYLVKERIPFCGKQTHLQGISLKNSLPLQYTERQMRSMELIFKDYGQIEGGILREIFGESDIDGENIVNLMKILKSNLGHIISHPSAQ